MGKKAIRLSVNELSKDSKRFLEDMQKEGDRGTAMISAAFLENILESLLRAYFVEDNKAVSELLDSNGPLGNFGSKVKLAFCIGFVSRMNYHDLGLIRKIRNEFAHMDRPIDFSVNAVAQMCASLKTPNMLPLQTKLSARDRFVMSVALISSQLLLIGLPVKHQEVRKDFAVAELVRV